MPEVGPGLSASITVSLWFNRQVDGGVIGEETHLRDDVLGEVVDVGQEQNRPKEQSPEAFAEQYINTSVSGFIFTLTGTSELSHLIFWYYLRGPSCGFGEQGNKDMYFSGTKA